MYGEVLTFDYPPSASQPLTGGRGSALAIPAHFAASCSDVGQRGCYSGLALCGWQPHARWLQEASQRALA